MNLYLGIDTSCYTTSVAAFTTAGELLADERSPLVISAGHVGLRQSEMVFQHNRNLPGLVEKVRKIAGPDARIQRVCASIAPRRDEDSYMPAFTVGANYGRVIAAAVERCQFIPYTHQENHILAGVWGSDFLGESEFGAVHLSGGTTEVLYVFRPTEGEMTIRRLAETDDLNAGQFIDRIGVSMGLPFPAGPHLEQLAATAAEAGPALPLAVRNMKLSFSGPASEAKRRWEKGCDAARLALAVQSCIAQSLKKLLENCQAATGIKKFLIVGGVSANHAIRTELTARLPQVMEVKFAPVRCCGDGAIGCAYAAYLTGIQAIR